jgi:hypothetical protein
VIALVPFLLHQRPNTFAHSTQEVANAEENKQDEEPHRKNSSAARNSSTKCEAELNTTRL